MIKVGFIGLGNVGGKLAGSLLRNGIDLTVRDLDKKLAQPFLDAGASWADSPREMAQNVDVLITCLPSPAASAMVMEAEDGVLAGLSEGKIWAEMSTTDKDEVLRLGEKVKAMGAEPVDCPVSGGCHRAATGNIAIFAGCERATFEIMLPLLTTMGRRILHTGPLGSASVLKVVTNYLATANLLSLCEALATAGVAGMDLNTTYEAIRISSGNSFVHETESQVILNGSRDISFTMDLVCKDIGLFNDVASRANLDLELAPVMEQIFKDGQDRYGPRELSPNIIRRLEEKVGVEILAPGFPHEMLDDEPEEPGYEVEVRDDKGRVLPERHCGTLYVRGPSVMSGYFGDLKATREVLSPDGWLNTGDLAYRVGNGIMITGREKDLIIINGRNIWPQDLEYLAEQQPEVRTGDASAFSVTGPAGQEQAVMMVQCRQSDEKKRTDLRERLYGLVHEEFAIDCLIELVPRNTLPRTTSGKLSRSGARKEYLKRIAPQQATELNEKLYTAAFRQRAI